MVTPVLRSDFSKLAPFPAQNNKDTETHVTHFLSVTLKFLLNICKKNEFH